MKTIIVISISLFLCGCQDYVERIFPKSKLTTEVQYLNDQTDKMEQPSASDLLSLYRISDNRKFDGLILRVHPISDVALVDEKEFVVQGANPWLSDDISRTNDIRNWETEITKWQEGEANVIRKPKEHSLVFAALQQTGNQLSQSNSSERYAVVASDLGEHGSRNLDFYDPCACRAARINPQRVVDQLNATYPMKSQAGITYILFFKPKTYEQQQAYDLSSSIVKSWLESNHAKVVIASSIPKAII